MGDEFVVPRGYEIKAGEDLVTAERLAKGDLLTFENAKKKISRAILLDPTIIKKLIKDEVLYHHHELYGVRFLELEIAFFSPVGTRLNSQLLAAWGTGMSASDAAGIYQHICRVMRGSRGIEVIKFAMQGNKKEISRYNNGLYLEFFNRLVEIIDCELDRINEENRKNLEKL